MLDSSLHPTSLYMKICCCHASNLKRITLYLIYAFLVFVSFTGHQTELKPNQRFFPPLFAGAMRHPFSKTKSKSSPSMGK